MARLDVAPPEAPGGVGLVAERAGVGQGGAGCYGVKECVFFNAV